MPVKQELLDKIAVAVKDFTQKCSDLQVTNKHKMGCTSAPDADLTGQSEVYKESIEWVEKLSPASAELDKLLIEAVGQISTPADAALKVPRENAWVWGGPTPLWYGSMADDTLVTGADYFEASNVIYVYGPVNEKQLAILSKYKQVFVQITDTCRAPGAQPESDLECAEKVSKLSLKYPNIVGGIMDDSTRTGHNTSKVIPAGHFKAVTEALRSHNPKLRLASVIYTHELDDYDFSNIMPYLDIINLWFWSKQELVEFDQRFAKCQKTFPGKEIIQGIFIHDYGCSDMGTPPALLRFQMQRAAKLIAEGALKGIIILGDREIRKWPASAEAVKDCLK